MNFFVTDIGNYFLTLFNLTTCKKPCDPTLGAFEDISPAQI